MTYPWCEHEVYRDTAALEEERYVRVLTCTPSSVTFIELGNKPALPSWLPRAHADELAASRQYVRVDDPPFPAPLALHIDEEAPSAVRKKLARRLEERDLWRARITDLVEGPNELYLNPSARTKAVLEVARKHGVRASAVHFWARRYFQAARSWNGLVRDYRRCGTGRSLDKPATKLLGRPRVNFGERDGRKTGLNVTPEIAGHFAWGANEYQKGGRSWRKCFNNALNKFYRTEVIGADGKKDYIDKEGPQPTFEQFYAHVQRRIGLQKVIRKLVGPTAYEMEHAPRTSTSARLGVGPGDLYALDATLVDQYVLSADRKEVIGRPVLYLVIDYYSHMIVGFYLGLENPSWTPASLAISQAILGKVAYCRTLGIEIDKSEWPAEHCPRHLSVDRGSELVGNDMSAALFALDITHVICPPARPDRKGLVENAMQLIEIDLTNPEARALHPRSMEDRALPGDATLTLKDMELKFVHWIRKYNSALRISRRQWPEGFVWRGRASALQLWEHGCHNARAPRRKDEAEVVFSLLRHDSVTAGKNGFHLERGLRYVTEDPHLQEILHQRPGKTMVRLPFYRDDRTVDHGIILFQGRLVTASLAPSCAAYAGMSMFEFHHLYRADKVAEADQAEQNRAMEQRYTNSAEAIDADAKAVKALPLVKRGRIPDARRAEMAREHRLAMAPKTAPTTLAVAPMPVGQPPPTAGSPRLYPTDMMEGDDE